MSWRRPGSWGNAASDCALPPGADLGNSALLSPMHAGEQSCCVGRSCRQAPCAEKLHGGAPVRLGITDCVLISGRESVGPMDTVQPALQDRAAGGCPPDACWGVTPLALSAQSGIDSGDFF